MSDPHDANQPPQLTTTHIGGGRRAWLVALLALVILGTFVYLGLSGGSSVLAPKSTPTAPALAAVPTPVTGPTPVASYDPNEIVSLRADPAAPVLYQYLGTALTINGQGILAILDPVGPLAYRGLYRIPVSQSAPTARLEFDAVTASVSHDDLDRIGEWTFPINSIAHGSGPPVEVLDTGGNATAGTLTNPDFNAVLANGYRLLVTTQNEGDAALMTIDVIVNSDLGFPDETFSMLAGPNDYGFGLERFQPGGYDAKVPIPSSLFGQTLSLALIASENSGPATATTRIGTWTLDIAKRIRDAGTTHPLEVHVDGRPITDSDPQILGSGYDLLVSQFVSDGKLNLGVALNLRPLPGPSPGPTR